jgi:hypothetical protein
LTGVPTLPSRGTGGSTAIAALVVVLAAVDAALVVIGMLVWEGHQRGHLSSTESATFVLLGISAAVGAAVYLLAAVAVATGAQAGVRVAAGLAWLRTAAVLVALAVIAVRLGSSAVVGPLGTTGAVFAVAEALIAIAALGAAARRTRRSS